MELSDNQTQKFSNEKNLQNANCSSESFNEIDHMLKNLSNELDSILMPSPSGPTDSISNTILRQHKSHDSHHQQQQQQIRQRQPSKHQQQLQQNSQGASVIHAS